MKTLDLALFALGIVGYYIQFTLSAPVYFPYILTILAGFALFIRNPGLTTIRIAALFGGLGLLSATAILIDGASAADIRRSLESTVLLVLSAAASYEIARVFARMTQREAMRLCLTVVGILLVGAALERLGPLRALSDTVRAAIHPADLFYAADERDIASYGSIRPKLFTSEPSHLGKMLAVFLSMIVLIEPERRRLILVLVLSALGYVIVNSPTILLPLVAVTAVLVTPGRRVAPRRVLLQVIAAIVLAVVLLGLAWIVLEERLILNREGSLTIRLLQPFYAMGIVLREAPFLGFGLGAGDRLIVPLTETLDAVASAAFLEFLLQSQTRMTFGNAYGALFLQFGMVGTAIWLWGLHRMERALAGRATLAFWMLMGAYFVMAGAINTPLVFMPAALFAAALYRRERPA